ncbi:hypothetical protein, partial [Staphylococcus epidermidis]|uniref:hypothetical protein n=1 Tax=Staphylococcus epidermidis TaxID=1282 RepID=UPI0021B42DDB
ISTVLTYYNFTSSFYANLLIILPISLSPIQTFFKQPKIRSFIFPIPYTLFSNFYFTYYQPILIPFYFIYPFPIP